MEVMLRWVEIGMGSPKGCVDSEIGDLGKQVVVDVDGPNCFVGPKPPKDKKGKKEVGLGFAKRPHHVWRVKSRIGAVSGISGWDPSPSIVGPVVVLLLLGLA